MVHSQTFQCSGALLKAGGTDLLSVAATEAEGWMRTRGELSHPLDHDSRQFLPISSEFLPLNNWTVVLVWFSPTEPFCLESNYPVIILRCAWSWLFHFTCGSCISLIGSVMPSVEIQAAENILNRCHLLFTLRGEYRENTAPLDSKLGAHFIFERPRLPAWCQLEGWPYFWYPLLSTRVQSLASCWTPKGCSSGRLGRNIEVRLLIWCFPRAPFLFGFSFAFFLGRLFLRFYLFFFFVFFFAEAWFCSVLNFPCTAWLVLFLESFRTWRTKGGFIGHLKSTVIPSKLLWKNDEHVCNERKRWIHAFIRVTIALRDVTWCQISRRTQGSVGLCGIRLIFNAGIMGPIVSWASQNDVQYGIWRGNAKRCDTKFQQKFLWASFEVALGYGSWPITVIDAIELSTVSAGCPFDILNEASRPKKEVN